MENPKKYPMDVGRSWVVLVSAIMSSCVTAGLMFGSVGVYFVTFRDYFHAENEQVSLVTAIPLALMLVSGPIASFMYETLGCRIGIMLSGLVASAAFLLTSFSQNITQLTLCFALVGLGMGMDSTSQMAVLTEYFEKYQRFALAFAPIGGAIGYVFSRLLVYLIDLYTWRGALIIVSGIALQKIVCGALMKSRKEKKLPKLEHFFSIRMLKDPLMFISGTSLILALSGFNIYLSMINALMIDRGLTEQMASTLVSFSAIANFSGRLIIPFLIHFSKIDSLVFAAVFSAIETVAIVLATFSDGATYFMADLSLMIFTCGMHVPLIGIIVIQLFGIEKLPKIIAITALPMALGMAILPKIAGYLADAYVLDAAFYFAASCTALASVVYTGIYFQQKRFKRKNNLQNELRFITEGLESE